MTLSEGMIQEFAQEASVTRRLLERLPENLKWKPHEKSMNLGRLATHIAEIPQWGSIIMGQDAFDMGAGEYKPAEPGSREEIHQLFETSARAFNQALEGKRDEEWMRQWQLLDKGQVVLDMPRVVAVRSFVMSHVIHHRGQLSVYLRLNNIPLPMIYGPSADEQG